MVILTRLRVVGYTALTPGYLINNDIRQPPPPCPLCNTAVLTVEHIISHCVNDRERNFSTIVAPL